jgi:NAD-dependent DNA ligase
MDIINTLNNTDDIFTTIHSLSTTDLETVIIYASDKYYNDEPVISDAIYDMLREFLMMRNPKSKVLKQVGSPVKSKNKVKLPYYLGSMDKIKPPSNRLNSWINTYNSPYIATDKLDGVSALLVYNNNTIKMYTRGTATHGQDITMLLRYIKIPSYNVIMTYLKKYNMGNTIAFRGELIISKKKFEKNWANTMKNARNSVAGLVNSKHINPLLAQDTNIVIYMIIDPLYNMVDMLKIISDLGFKTVHSKIFKTINFELLSKYLLKRRTKSKYMIDGIQIMMFMI